MGLISNLEIICAQFAFDVCVVAGDGGGGGGGGARLQLVVAPPQSFGELESFSFERKIKTSESAALALCLDETLRFARKNRSNQV